MKKAKIFIYLNILLAITCIVVIYNFFNFHIYSFSGILTFFVLSLLADFLSVNNPTLGKVTISSSIEYATVILFGPLISIVLCLLSYVIYFFAKEYKTDKNLSKLAFNLSLFTITISAVSITYFVFGGVLGKVQEASLLSLVIPGVVYYAMNIAILTMLFTLLKKNKYTAILKSNLKWAVPNFFALIPLGYLIAFIYSVTSLTGVILFVIPLLIARHAIKLYMDMREMYLETIGSLAATIDAKDRYTLGHSDRVSQYAYAIAEELKLPEDEIENIKSIAILHDLGKIAVPEYILNKPSKLTDDEYEIMKYHSVYGANILKKIKFLNAYEVIRAHHEHFDGRGYPDKLVGGDIPVAARIIAVADSFDAMTTDRPYRPGWTHQKALDELEKCSLRQFDPQVVNAFKKVLPGIKIKEPEWDEIILPEELLNKLQSYTGGASNVL
jgi:putative nucleotidyltransferase with HDIG domain